jgi:hypothetical protein
VNKRLKVSHYGCDIFKERSSVEVSYSARVSPSPAIVAGFAVRRGICKHDRFWHRCARLHSAVALVFDSTA